MLKIISLFHSSYFFKKDLLEDVYSNMKRFLAKEIFLRNIYIFKCLRFVPEIYPSITFSSSLKYLYNLRKNQLLNILQRFVNPHGTFFPNFFPLQFYNNLFIKLLLGLVCYRSPINLHNGLPIPKNAL